MLDAFSHRKSSKIPDGVIQSVSESLEIDKTVSEHVNILVS
jgi:hypothetical protein